MDILEEVTKIAKGKSTQGGNWWKVILIIAAVVGVFFLVFKVAKMFLPKVDNDKVRDMYIPKMGRRR